MRLNTLSKVLGLAAALAMPLALVGCDDDETDPGTDSGVRNDASVGSDATVTPGPDANTNTDATAPMGDARTDATTGGDAAGDASNG